MKGRRVQGVPSLFIVAFMFVPMCSLESRDPIKRVLRVAREVRVVALMNGRLSVLRWTPHGFDRLNAEPHMRLLHSGFLQNVESQPGHEALRVEGSSYTYQELFEIAAGMSATLMQHDPGQGELTAVFGRRSLLTYSGLLATLTLCVQKTNLL